MSEIEIVKPGEVVKANNDLFRCKFKLKDIVACRIFMAFASLVDHNSVKQNESFIEYSIPASSILSENSNGGDNYDQLLDAAHILLKHTIDQKIGKTEFVAYTLFSKIQYKNGTITGQFHKDLVPFFIIAREKFTKMRLDEFMQLPSIYSQSIFGFLKSWSDRREVNISVKDLHNMLGTPDSFRRNFSDFNKRVLEKAHKDINKLTSLKYDYEAIKVGRSYKEIKFVFHKSVNTHKTKPTSLSIPNTPDVQDMSKTNLQPKFNEFLDKFPDGKINHLTAGMKWYRLNDLGNAPLAADVPDGNTLSVIEFLEQWQGNDQ